MTPDQVSQTIADFEAANNAKMAWFICGDPVGVLPYVDRAFCQFLSNAITSHLAVILGPMPKATP